MAETDQLKLAFYGDDITGSTDSMEALVLAGVPTVLFMEPPTIELVREKFPGVQAVGLAGMSRTMTPEEMEAELPGMFSSLRELGAPVTHYKVCSTFDSAPGIGSIGRAAEIGMEVFETDFVPIAIGAPKLKRYVVFGNHFATLEGRTYRLDRHPVMSKHPITPMDEGDLRIHLSKQTDKQIGLIDVNCLALDDGKVGTDLQKQVGAGAEMIFLDTVDHAHLLKVGRLLWGLGKEDQSFVVGSSGVEFALAEHWQQSGMIKAPRDFESAGEVDAVVAISGSASPWTATQIRWALDHGFKGIPLRGDQLIDPETQEGERDRVVRNVVGMQKGGESVIIYSALGPDDPQIQKTKEKSSQLGLQKSKTGEILGTQQGLILKEILKQTGLRRAAVAGGDTCGYVLRQLGIFVLEFIVPLGPAAPLCRASSRISSFDGIDISLKGGQLGALEFFESLRLGIHD